MFKQPDDVICISDTHLTSNDLASRSLFQKMFDRLPRDRAEREYLMCRDTVHQIHEEFVSNLESVGPWKLLIHFGDMTGGYLERGLYHPSVAPLADAAMVRYRRIGTDVYVCWGNHDTGYPGIEGALSAESVAICHQISPLFWKKELGNVLFIGVCTPILDHDDREDHRVIKQRCEEQEDFVRNALSENSGRKWVLCTHDLQIGNLDKVIAPYTANLIMCLYGDRHVPIIGPLMQLSGLISPRSVASLCKRRSQLCPSVAPFGWRGGGMLMGACEGEKLSLRRRQMPMPQKIQDQVAALPFSSLPRFLWWVIHSRIT